MEKIIVIGGGIAALSAAQAAREVSETARIHLICAEKRLPYYRLRICELFSGLSEQKLIMRNNQWFIDNNIEMVCARATSIDVNQKQVKFDDGSYLFYDKLILATGAEGNTVEIKGANPAICYAVRKIADIDKIKALSGPVAIIGGGVLGLEAAWHLSKAGRPVVMIERDEMLLKRQLDEESSRFLLNITEKAGLRVALNGFIDSYADDKLILSDGRTFAAETLIFSIGVKPNIGLAKSAGLETNRGFIVNDKMQTNQPDIYACGDCAELDGAVPGLWAIAMNQGTIAGKNALGQDNSYLAETLPYTVQAMGTKIWSSGNSGADCLCVKSSVEGNLTKLFFDADNCLCSAILIGDIAKSIALKKAIGQKMAKEEAQATFL